MIHHLDRQLSDMTGVWFVVTDTTIFNPVISREYEGGPIHLNVGTVL